MNKVFENKIPKVEVFLCFCFVLFSYICQATLILRSVPVKKKTCTWINMFVMLSILQSQFIDKDSKKTKNSEHIVVLLLFLFTLDGLKTFGKEDK